MVDCDASTGKQAVGKGTRRAGRLACVILTLFVLCSSSVWLASAQKPEDSSNLRCVPPISSALRRKIDPVLLKQLAEGEERYAHVIVEVTGAADLTTAMTASDPSQRRRAVISSLQATASESQSPVRAILASQEATGGATNVRSFWIFNGLAADVDLNTVLALASRPEVKIVRLDRQYHITDHPQLLPDTLLDGQEVGSNIAQIRADLAWSALRIDGSGTVVAHVDTGVDWLHPALLPRYRGYDPHGLHQHACNWFDAIGKGALYPVDGNGHGTHTMGTIVGGEGIGVAPGAEWIAVRAFNSQGIALESWLHAALQWVLDPGPGCVPPDVVNNSWGNSSGGIPNFRADVQAIRAAGIFAAFAAGNDGPDSSSIGAPASYPESFGVGAVTSGDAVANFSSRGPSTWFGSNLIKPEVTAPGVNVRSSMPGGAYGESNGTSMATPHVTGLAALMLQASPGLTVTQIESIIKQTARPLGSSTPNNDYGWGRIDAYAAVASVANVGTVSGAVTGAHDGSPVADALLIATSVTTSTSSAVTTDADGTYTLALAPGEYTLAASAFSFISQSQQIEVQVDATLTEDFALSKLPAGILTGRVTGNGQPIKPPGHTVYLPFVTRDAHINTHAASHSAGTTFGSQSASGYPTVVVEGTPITLTPDADGYYTAYLPAGSYTLTVSSPGYRVATASEVPIVVQGTTVRNFDLAPAPTILLVDSGAWYYDSQIHYYRQALDRLSYTYDVWTIDEPVNGAPRVSDLRPYDIVFWSSPGDSPGYVNAGQALASYLEDGGSLFLSGQDVAYYDDYFPHIYAAYFRDYLKAKYVRDNTGISDLTGQAGNLFDGLTFSIEGLGGADNQTSPDEIGVLDPDFASSVVSYIGDGSAGQEVGLCLPYRAVYLSFGLEAITSTMVRTEVIGRSIAWFTAPPVSAGLEVTPSEQSLVGEFGGSVTHTVRVRNTAESGDPDIFSLSLAGSTWPTAVITPSVTLAPCASKAAAFSVEVPTTANWADADSVTITVRSTATPWLTAAATSQTRAPAPVLLVDDDRWYNVEDHYQDALNTNSIAFDKWTVPWSYGGSSPPSPTADTMRKYPIVIWFSAYDWHQPLTPEEEQQLAAYLEGGGRLYYGGQDYLFQSEGPTDFARTYLGVYTYTEDFTSTVVTGIITNPIGTGLGPEELVYPYQNFSDALTPTATAAVAFVGQAGQPNALTNVGANWRTTFFAFNADGLSGPALDRLIQRVTGWLGWLGTSSVQADRPVARHGDTLTYTVVMHNDGHLGIPSAHLSATFTSDLTPIPASITGGATWDASQSAFTWSGPLDRDQTHTVTYQATITSPLPLGHVLSHTVWIGYDSHTIEFDRVAFTPVDVPLLNESTFSASPSVGERGSLLTYTLRARNTGVVESVVTATNVLPSSLALVPNSLEPSRGIAYTEGRIVSWSVPISVQDYATLTYTAVITDVPARSLIRNRALLEDVLGHTLSVDALTVVEGPRTYLPIIFAGVRP